jgi:hypothetical protein
MEACQKTRLRAVGAALLVSLSIFLVKRWILCKNILGASPPPRPHPFLGTPTVIDRRLETLARSSCWIPHAIADTPCNAPL